MIYIKPFSTFVIVDNDQNISSAGRLGNQPWNLSWEWDRKSYFMHGPLIGFKHKKDDAYIFVYPNRIQDL